MKWQQAASTRVGGWRGLCRSMYSSHLTYICLHTLCYHLVCKWYTINSFVRGAATVEDYVDCSLSDTAAAPWYQPAHSLLLSAAVKSHVCSWLSWGQGVTHNISCIIPVHNEPPCMSCGYQFNCLTKTRKRELLWKIDCGQILTLSDHPPLSPVILVQSSL